MTPKTLLPLLLSHGDAVVSLVPREPKPTNTPFDAAAAVVAALAPGSRALLLGFAGGSIAAMLRVLGWKHPLDAVDLDRRAGTLYREATAGWGGRVSVRRAEAGRFLAAYEGPRWDAIVEDLSIPDGDTLTKPPVSLTALPELCARVLAPHGVVVTNLLPVRGWTWARLQERIARPFRGAAIVSFREWDNRLLVTGPSLPGPRALGARVRRELAFIGSRVGREIRVTSFPRPRPRDNREP